MDMLRNLLGSNETLQKLGLGAPKPKFSCCLFKNKTGDILFYINNPMKRLK